MVWNASSTWPALPEKVMASPLLATPRTVRPWLASQVEAAATWAALGPKLAPKLSGVSH